MLQVFTWELAKVKYYNICIVMSTLYYTIANNYHVVIIFFLLAGVSKLPITLAISAVFVLLFLLLLATILSLILLGVKFHKRSIPT